MAEVDFGASAFHASLVTRSTLSHGDLESERQDTTVRTLKMSEVRHLTLKFNSNIYIRLISYNMEENRSLLSVALCPANMKASLIIILSYDIAVIQWITSCHKNRMSTRVITLWRIYVKPLTTSVSTMHLIIEIMFIINRAKATP